MSNNSKSAQAQAVPGCVPFSGSAGEEGLQGRGGRRMESIDLEKDFGILRPGCCPLAPGSLSTAAPVWRAGQPAAIFPRKAKS